jgi:hypothetical protein
MKYYFTFTLRAVIKKTDKHKHWRSHEWCVGGCLFSHLGKEFGHPQIVKNGIII